jgi:dTDP-4-amino-4,6-dideoxygalactose transaminase
VPPSTQSPAAGAPAPADQEVVPLSDIALSEAELEAVLDAYRSGWLSTGPRTARFEEAFAEYTGVAHAIAVANGTAALHLAYLAAGVGPGDEVVVPAITFVATANAVQFAGGRVVFADMSRDDYCLDVDDAIARATSSTAGCCGAE